jgi:hypothetical protein
LRNGFVVDNILKRTKPATPITRALRRHLMQQWAKFIEQPWGEHSHNVVKFREGAA